MKALLLAASLALLAVPGASAKGFQPGDLRLCNQSRCVKIMDAPATAGFQRLIYTAPQPTPVGRAPLGARAYRLCFSNGYATGIVAGARLDRFLSYGVVIGRFTRGTWYRVPPVASAELRRLARRLEPMRVTRDALARSR
jgi:hypothetical protein